MIRWLGAIVFLGIAAFVTYAVVERNHHLSFLPNRLHVTNIVYKNEASWGFGPGGNETRIIAYELPDAVAREIQLSGTRFFHGTQQNCVGAPDYDWQGCYDKWHHTPVLLDGSDDHANGTTSHRISDFLNRYGFGIGVDSKVGQEIDNALSTEGSYVAYGRIGILIVIPDKRRVVYAYNG
jgi:hypothetical protein